MSKTTGELILSLAEQSGAALDEAQIKSIQAIETELPEGIAEKIQGSLYTVESALANSEITNKIKADSLDAVDQKLQNMAMQLGQDSDFVQKLKDTKGTYNGMDLLGSAVLANHKAALEKAKEGAPKGDQKELQEEITKLNAQIVSHNENSITQIDHDDTVNGYEDLLKESAAKMLGMRSNLLFAGRNWSNKQISAEINMSTSNMLLNTELDALGVSMVEKEGTLKLETKEGKPHFVDNKEVTPLDFANSLLARHKLLTVSDPNKPTTPTVATSVASVVDSPGLAAAIEKAKASNQTIQDRIGATL